MQEQNNGNAGAAERTGRYPDRKPVHEFKASLSADGKYWLFRQVTTWIIPVNYLGTILKNAGAQPARDCVSTNGGGGDGVASAVASGVGGKNTKVRGKDDRAS